MSRIALHLAWVLALTTLLGASSLAQAPVTLAGTGTLATPTNGREGRGGGGVANILSAARADEKAVAKAASKGIKVAPREIPTEAEGER